MDHIPGKRNPYDLAPIPETCFYLSLQHPDFLKGSKCLCNEKQAFPTLGAEVNGCRVPADREKQSIFHYPAKATGCLGCQQFLDNKDNPYTQSPHLKRRSLYNHLLGCKSQAKAGEVTSTSHLSL